MPPEQSLGANGKPFVFPEGSLGANGLPFMFPE